MEKTSGVKHLGYLDGLRGAAALFVVWHHAYLQVADRAPQSDFAAQFHPVFFFGRYAVDLFIVLSGFCLMLPVIRNGGTLRGGTLRGGAAQFFARRAWRIVPTYWLAVVFSALLAATIIKAKTGTHWDMSIPLSGRSLGSHFLLIHDATGHDYNINHAFWSIAVEWRIYFFFPLLLWSWRALGAVKTTLATVVLSYALFMVCKRFDAEGLTAYFLGLFAMGMLGATLAFEAKWKTLPWGVLTLLLSAVVVIVSHFRIRNGELLSYSLQDEAVGLWSMCLLIYLSTAERGWVYRFFSWKPLVFLGTFAYSIYLVHAPLLQILWQYVFAPLQDQPTPMFLALMLLGTLPILAVCYGFFHFCERPFLRRKAKASAETLVRESVEKPR